MLPSSRSWNARREHPGSVSVSRLGEPWSYQARYADSVRPLQDSRAGALPLGMVSHRHRIRSGSQHLLAARLEAGEWHRQRPVWGTPGPLHAPSPVGVCQDESVRAGFASASEHSRQACHGDRQGYRLPDTWIAVLVTVPSRHRGGQVAFEQCPGSPYRGSGRRLALTGRRIGPSHGVVHALTQVGSLTCQRLSAVVDGSIVPSGGYGQRPSADSAVGPCGPRTARSPLIRLGGGDTR